MLSSIRLKTAILFFCLFQTACYKYETQFDGPYDDSQAVELVELPKVLVYVTSARVYLADKRGKNPVEIYSSGTVEIASINNNHTRVLFKSRTENIQIYDINTERIIGEVANSDKAIWFDYHTNNETIYFLTYEGILDTSGPEVLASRPVDLGSLVPFTSVRSAVVLENGQILASLKLDSSTYDGLLYLTDGVTEIESRPVNDYLTNMRLSADESYIIGTAGVHDVFEHSVPSLDILSDYPNYYIGTSGYFYVTNDDNIVIPFSSNINSVGEVTAIDN